MNYIVFFFAWQNSKVLWILLPSVKVHDPKFYLELSKSAPSHAYMISNYLGPKGQIEVKVLRGETCFEHGFSAGLSCHLITPCVPGDSGSPLLDAVNGKCIGIHVGGMMPHK